MQKYISNYNDPIYKDYLDKLEIYYNYKLKILKKGSNDNQYFKEDKDKFELKYNTMELVLHKPKYKDIFNEIDELKEEKNKLLIEYNELQYRILNNLNNEKDYKKYQNIVDKLTQFDGKVKDLLDYYMQINAINKNLFNANQKDIDNLHKDKTELYDKIIKENDSILNRKYISDYLKLFKLNNELYNKHFKNIDYFILELPKIKENNIKTISKPKKEPEKKKKPKKSDEEIEKEKRTKLKKKLQEKLENTDKDKLKKLEKSVRDKLFKVFKFSNEKECASRSRSYDYFTKKDDILQIIEENKEIKDRLPQNYRGLTKAKICEELYKM